MRCSECESEAVHELNLLENTKVPFCRPHLMRAFRRLRVADKEILRFRCNEICAEWSLGRKHHSRSKVDAAGLVQITEAFCSGMSITAVAVKLGVSKCLVHRYLTKLTDIYSDEPAYMPRSKPRDYEDIGAVG